MQSNAKKQCNAVQSNAHQRTTVHCKATRSNASSATKRNAGNRQRIETHCKPTRATATQCTAMQRTPHQCNAT
eukprot:4248139-Pyramimonas_sp.AAC.1